MAALHSCGVDLSDKKITIQLSPAERKKYSPVFDVAIAVAILVALGKITSIPRNTVFLGILSLDGSIRTIDGILPLITAAVELEFKNIILPTTSYYPNLTNQLLIEVAHLNELVTYLLTGQTTLHETREVLSNERKSSIYTKDFQAIIGQKETKRVLEIAAAGMHHVLLIGPPGCGKSMLAEAFPSISPPLEEKQQIEVLSVYQLAQKTCEALPFPPMRSPHHSSSAISLIGRGTFPKPGEISLAHRGIF